MSGDSNSRRTLSPQLDNQNHKHLSTRTDGNLIFDDRNPRKLKNLGRKFVMILTTQTCGVKFAS
ncbi:hypothetical protein POPTR_001G252604v4 [Populus trichocarpa]|uniref:Uncharacterized protein n=1 Tax=Populus trichocarpa TaxID=3694 RepID=A0ACC0TKZ9_POPTR|nr:hypothetical protein POPTR_001G252604v4 [Populus trichocarpa]